ncbi:hypothetical protein [Pannonibacter tanglangensis]|uniref:hypothetical protein n=1 Tax=Pannonibacter tanglangensis TaxID=2750084 RepID=UPI001AD8D769|nr:hypothetical protein [Pannonibacter sp. XCT-34]
MFVRQAYEFASSRGAAAARLLPGRARTRFARLLAAGLALQILLVPLFLSLALRTAQAENLAIVELQAKAEEGYGRLILTFKDKTLLPHYDATVTSGVLRIAFEEPIAISVDDVPLQLRDYIAVARRDPDGTAIRFALKDKFRINTLEAGEKLFVDILPANWQGLPPGLPDDVVRELARRAEEAMRQVRALEQARLKAEEGPRVDLRIGEHPTFTRLVFDWTVQFDTSFVREDDIVRVTFNQAAQLDVSRLRANLPPGVVDATSFLDGGKLKFLMRIDPTVDIRAFREEQTYVIDITPTESRATDPVNAAIGEALNGRPQGAQQLIVAPATRREDQPPAPVDPAAAAPAAPAPAPGGGPPGGTFGQPETAPRPGAEGPQVEPLPVLADAGPVAGPAFALPRAKPGTSTPAPVQMAAGTVLPEGGDPSTVGSVAFMPPAAEAAPAIQVAETATGTPAREPRVLGAQKDFGDRIINAIPLDPMPFSGSPSVQASDQGEPQPRVLQGVEIPQAIDLRQAGPSPSQDPWRAQGGAPTPEPRSVLPTPEPSPESLPVDAANEVRNFVAAEARRIGNTVRVVFPFREPVATAVFRRNDSIWMLFDTTATIDIRAIRSALADVATGIEMKEFPDHQALRVDVVSSALATVGADGNAWNLVVGDMIVEPTRPLAIERNVRSDGGSVLRIPFQQPQKIRTLTDPFVGDQIVVVTGFGPARGLLKPQKFVDLETLASAHGVAVVPQTDGFKPELAGDDIILQREQGLTLSNGNQRGSRVLNTIVDPNQPNYVDFTSLTTKDEEEFMKRRMELETALTNAPEERRRAPRMDLARFFLAHLLPYEALGMMQLALEEDPALAEESAFNLMMGAAQTLAARPDQAYPHLNRPDLKNSPDAAVWQTIVEVALGNWPGARISMPRGRAVIGNYPVSIQAEFNIAAAQAMVELNDFGMANAILAEIEPSLISPVQAARYDLLRGRVADASGRSLEALTAFDLVARTDDRPRAAEATYRALRIRHRDGELTTEQTVDELATLATWWRGDEVELRTLRFLAQLQAERGNYREAFEAMKLAVQSDSESETTRLLQEEMNALFANLFLNGKANEMPAVKALALFYDFREMTPPGRQGDEMVRGLAKRLVEVELLDQAAELLQHQVDNRLKGAARSQIAADLAAIYLMDRKPERALAVLNRTRQANLPSTLDRQRNIVEARALTESGRPDLALELVRNMRGAEVDRLRADTFWAAQSWREAGDQLEAMYGSRWSDNIPLEQIERNDILKAGIAYSLAGDQLSLDRLRTKYLPKMSDSPEAFAFDVVTRPIEAQGVEFLEVARGLAAIDTLSTFMEEYRRQYMSPEPGGESMANAQTGNG